MTSPIRSRVSSPSWGAYHNEDPFVNAYRWAREKVALVPARAGARALGKRVASWLREIPLRKGETGLGFRQLRDNETLRFRPGAGGLALKCHSGTLLVTQEGDLDDHVLGPQTEFRTAGRGLVVVWALSDATLTAGRAQAARRGTEALFPPAAA